jgi:hypothetical protein
MDQTYTTTEDNGHTQKWWLKDQLHREDGPAVERSNGDKYWYLNGKRHRVGGPAIIEAHGNVEWWVNGRRTKITPRQLEVLESLPSTSNSEYGPIKKLIEMGLAVCLPNVKTFQNPMYETTDIGKKYLKYRSTK